MALKKKHMEDLLKFSLKIVRKSEDITQQYFNTKIKHKLKENKTPVTKADTECEKYLVKKIHSKYPGHSILAEESGIADNKSEFKWIIDPIDGTKNFMRGYPFWGTLLALEHESDVVLGVISMPALYEVIYAAKGFGCFCNDKKMKVSKTEELGKSYLIYGGIEYILNEPYKERFFTLASLCNYDRGFGDCHGHSFILKGMAEIMVDPHVEPYDIAATKICIEEAGGILTDIKGNNTIYGGNALISNGILHGELLELLNN
jgi:histidinol phosphatase-like enzyme (inositol monophosphatase family)